MKCICDRTSGRYPSLAKNPEEHWLSCPMAGDDPHPGAVGYAKYGNIVTIVYPTLRDAICKQCGKTGAEHTAGCCPTSGGFEFL